MKYAFDTNIYQIWRNINDPAIQKIAQHPTIQTIKKCFLEVEDGASLIIPRIILTEHPGENRCPYRKGARTVGC